MPPLRALERLGFEHETLDLSTGFKVLEINEALRELEQLGAIVPALEGHTSLLYGDLIDYITNQGFRTLGLLALVEPRAARELGELLVRGLAAANHPSWPLALAVTDERTVSEERQAPSRWPELAEIPLVYTAELARLLIWPWEPLLEPNPAALRGSARTYGRAALAPYRIDIRILSALARGRNTTQRGWVSEPSAPAVVGALFGSMEDALGEARLDEHHWRVGAAAISPVDPEVLLAVRIVLNSDNGWALREVAGRGDLPMIDAVVDVVDELNEQAR